VVKAKKAGDPRRAFLRGPSPKEGDGKAPHGQEGGHIEDARKEMEL
jgi:hypothetical protein